jgi:hypothetical protein
MLESRSLANGSSNNKKQDEFEKTLEAFNSNLVWRATYALIDHKDFQWSPEWISSKLGVSETDAIDALLGLEQLGLIRKTENGFEQGKLQIITEENKIDASKLMSHHRLLSEEILNLMEPDRSGAYYNFLASGDKNSLQELYAEIKDVFDKFLKKHQVNKSKNDSIFAFSFTTVDVPKDGDQGGPA